MPPLIYSACQDPKFLLGIHGRGEASIAANGKSGTNLGIDYKLISEAIAPSELEIGIIQSHDQAGSDSSIQLKMK